MTRENNWKIPEIMPKIYLFLGFLLSLLLLIIPIGEKIEVSVFEEQVSNFNRLTDKMSQDLDIVLENKVNAVKHIAGYLNDNTYTDVNDVISNLKRIESYQAGENISTYLIDDLGTCYSSDGQVFGGKDSVAFLSKGRSVYVARLTVIEREKESLFVAQKLLQEIRVEDVVFTHVIMELDIAGLTDFLSIHDISDAANTYVIHKDGGNVYGSNSGTYILGTDDIFSVMGSAEYLYGCSKEQFFDDIKNGASDTIAISHNEQEYLVSYQKLGTADWYAVMVVSKDAVSGNVMQLVHTIIAYVLAFMLLLFLVIGLFAYHINQKINEIQMENRKKLQQAMDNEQKANRAKTNFLSSMSHDIRTPMDAVMGMMNLAKKNLDQPKKAEACLDKAMISGKHLLTLISDILDISKIESGKMTLHVDQVYLPNYLDELENMMNSQLEERNLEFNFERETIHYDYVSMDSLRLNQVYLNLYSNAIKYTAENGCINVKFYQEYEQENPTKVTLVYQVSDTGIGMSKEFQKNMYHSFERAEDTRVNKTLGTGMGLAIVNELVQLMGGCVTCESEVDCGTTFVVKIEVDVVNDGDMLQLVELDISEVEQVKLEGTHIMVVEDNEINGDIMEEVLKGYGVFVTRASNGQECLEALLGDTKFDLILMDVHMPVMDGKEATRKIRELPNEELRNIPVIAITADAFVDDIVACKDAGMNEHIAKPVEEEQMIFMIQKWIGENRSDL